MSENFLALLKMEYTVVRAVFHFNELSVQSNQKPRRKTPEYWAFVLREYPELAEYFTGWAALPTRAWVQLLSEQPQFSEYCTHWAGFSPLPLPGFSGCTQWTSRQRQPLA